MHTRTTTRIRNHTLMTRSTYPVLRDRALKPQLIQPAFALADGGYVTARRRQRRSATSHERKSTPRVICARPFAVVTVTQCQQQRSEARRKPRRKRNVHGGLSPHNTRTQNAQHTCTTHVHKHVSTTRRASHVWSHCTHGAGFGNAYLSSEQPHQHLPEREHVALA